MEKIIISGFADEISPELDKQLQVVRELGMDHISLRSADGKGIAEYTAEEFAEKLLPRLDEAQVKISSMGSPIGKIQIDSEEDFEKQKASQNHIAIKDAYFDDKENIILTHDDKTYIYPTGGVPVLINSYYVNAKTYLVREEDVYGPHMIYKNGLSKGNLENCQLYPEVMLLYFEIFPVYIQDKGYAYYSFDNKQVIDQIYLEAQPFDASDTAIVKIDNKGYSLIDEEGQILTKNTYYRMEYIGSSYYVVYNENGMYGIIDTTGEEIFPIEYTSLPETPIIEYNDENYMMLNKNGRSYIYDVNNDMEELFSIEGDLTFHQEGYFSDGYHYYTMDGESIE